MEIIKVVGQDIRVNLSKVESWYFHKSSGSFEVMFSFQGRTLRWVWKRNDISEHDFDNIIKVLDEGAFDLQDEDLYDDGIIEKDARKGRKAWD